MAVVTKYGRGYKDPASIQLPPPAHAEGRPRVNVSGPVAIANGDSSGSKVYFGKLRSSDIPLPSSILYHEAITGLTSFSIGLEKDGSATINGSSRAALFASALDLSSAGSKSMVAAIATADLGKRIWELLGYTYDPGSEYDLVGVTGADASAAKSLSGFFWTAKK